MHLDFLRPLYDEIGDCVSVYLAADGGIAVPRDGVAAAFRFSLEGG